MRIVTPKAAGWSLTQTGVGFDTPAAVAVVADTIVRHGWTRVVLEPVMVALSGDRLNRPDLDEAAWPHLPSRRLGLGRGTDCTPSSAMAHVLSLAHRSATPSAEREMVNRQAPMSRPAPAMAP